MCSCTRGADLANSFGLELSLEAGCEATLFGLVYLPAEFLEGERLGECDRSPSKDGTFKKFEIIGYSRSWSSASPKALALAEPVFCIKLASFLEMESKKE